MRTLFLSIGLLLAACAQRPSAAPPAVVPADQHSNLAPTSALDGTNWRVIAVNDRATPRDDGYFLRFSGDSLSAKFGCNGMGGDYRLNGDHLAVASLSQTLIGCPEPSARFEREGSAILQSNMRVERPAERRLRLVSEAGSIDLEQAA